MTTCLIPATFFAQTNTDSLNTPISPPAPVFMDLEAEEDEQMKVYDERQLPTGSGMIGDFSRPKADTIQLTTEDAPWPEGATEPVPLNIDNLRELIGYPDIYRHADIEGSILFEVLVDTLGNVTRYAIDSTYLGGKKPTPRNIRRFSYKEGFAKISEAHILKLKFIPATDKSGKKVAAWVRVPFNWRLLN